MKTASAAEKVLATALAILLGSCGTTRHATAGPASARDLPRYALVVEQTADGRVAHTWRPIEALDRTNFQFSRNATIPLKGIVRVSADRQAYCEARRQQCESDCLASSKPIPVGHLRYPAYRGPWRANKGWWCEQACIKLAEMCIRGMGEWAEESAAEFDAIEPAVDWVKNHREELLVGTVIVIVGVAFAVAVAASAGGALILVPLVLLAEDASAPASIIGLAKNAP